MGSRSSRNVDTEVTLHRMLTNNVYSCSSIFTMFAWSITAYCLTILIEEHHFTGWYPSISLYIRKSRSGRRLAYSKRTARNNTLFMRTIFTLTLSGWCRVFGEGKITGKNGFGSATKLGTTNKIFVAATQNSATATKRFVDKTKHFVVVTIFLSLF